MKGTLLCVLAFLMVRSQENVMNKYVQVGEYIDYQKVSTCFIKLGDNCIKIFIWGGISSDIRSEIEFYGEAYIR